LQLNATKNSISTLAVAKGLCWVASHAGFVFAAALSLGSLVSTSASADVVINFIESNGGIQVTGSDFAGNSINIFKSSAEEFHISSQHFPTGYTPDLTLIRIGIERISSGYLFALTEGGAVSDYVWVHTFFDDPRFTVIDFVYFNPTGIAPAEPTATVVENGSLQFVVMMWDKRSPFRCSRRSPQSPNLRPGQCCFSASPASASSLIAATPSQH
jgi:hypothetical protein